MSNKDLPSLLHHIDRKGWFMNLGHGVIVMTHPDHPSIREEYTEEQFLEVLQRAAWFASDLSDGAGVEPPAA